MPNIKSIIKNLTKKCHTNNPFEICKALDISVRFKDLGKIRGMYIYSLRHKIITINNWLDAQEHDQVCAHELGHAVLHKNTNTVFLDKYTYIITDKIEIEANMFAAELLIKDESLKEYSSYTFAQAAAALKVHENLIEYKFKSLSNH